MAKGVRRIATAVFAISVTDVTAGETRPGSPAAEPELAALTRSWNEAWLKKDAAAVDRLMAPGYVYVSPDGRAADRAAILAIARSPAYRPEQGTRTELAVTSLGPDAAVVLHRWQGSGTYEGKPYRDDHRCTMVGARRGRRWLVAWEQCSAITGGATPPATGEASVEAVVRALEAQRVEAVLKADTAALERILGPELTYMHSSGVLDTKESFLASLSSGRMKYEGFDESDLRVRVHGDAAVLTGRVTARVQRGGDHLVLDLALTAVYARAEDAGWRLVAWQTTRLPE